MIISTVRTKDVQIRKKYYMRLIHSKTCFLCRDCWSRTCLMDFWTFEGSWVGYWRRSCPSSDHFLQQKVASFSRGNFQQAWGLFCTRTQSCSDSRHCSLAQSLDPDHWSFRWSNPCLLWTYSSALWGWALLEAAWRVSFAWGSQEGCCPMQCSLAGVKIIDIIPLVW